MCFRQTNLCSHRKQYYILIKRQVHILEIVLLLMKFDYLILVKVVVVIYWSLIRVIIQSDQIQATGPHRIVILTQVKLNLLEIL